MTAGLAVRSGIGGALRASAAMRRDTAGVAAIEFALLSALFFLAICVALDFGFLYLERSKMNEAVGGAAVNAFSSADNVNFSALPGYVRALADDQTLDVTTSCNGVSGNCTNLSRTCACLKTNGNYVAGTCGASCSGSNFTAGSTAGYYLTVHAAHSFQPLIVPRSVLGNAQIAQQATVRLQ